MFEDIIIKNTSLLMLNYRKKTMMTNSSVNNVK